MIFDFPYRALVVGASGAIGNAFAQILRADGVCQLVSSLSRSSHPGFDLRNEASVEQAASEIAKLGPFHIVIDATGALQIDDFGPEKALRSVHAAGLEMQMQINAIGPILLLKSLVQQSALAMQGPAIYAKLSARVGSISDNQKGGWYAYRASKAALNMLLHTAAIELQRKNPQLLVAAMQPGTVESTLSAPFLLGQPVVISPETSAQGLLRALASYSKARRELLEPGDSLKNPSDHPTLNQGAVFFDYQGQPIGW